MFDPFIEKLQYGAALTAGDRFKLEALCDRPRHVAPRQDLIREGEHANTIHLVLEGFACRYKTVPEGGRQIMALLVPGDLCDLHGPILMEMDHSIATVSNCTIAEIPHAKLVQAMEASPRITRALWWSALVDKGTLREWLVSMGQRDTNQQMAHLMCELLVRLRAVGMADENGYNLPLTQSDFAEALGATTVHVNRVVQALRRLGLIIWRGKRLTIPDPDRLKEFCGFEPNYLHLCDRVHA